MKNDEAKRIEIETSGQSGSQRSYITDNVRKKLGLKSTSTGDPSPEHIWRECLPKQRCEIVTLPHHTINNEYVKITVLNLPIICLPLPKSIGLRDHPHLQELELANCSEVSNSINILIGLNHHWDFLIGESIRGDSGPTAVRSKLGWLLSCLNSETKFNVVSSLVISSKAREKQ